MSDTKDNLAGWWVPVAQYWRQSALPHAGSWQRVRNGAGAEFHAVVLAGRDGWNGGNYDPVPGIVEWFKPRRWFKSRSDLTGDQEAISLAKREIAGATCTIESGDLETAFDMSGIPVAPPGVSPDDAADRLYDHLSLTPTTGVISHGSRGWTVMIWRKPWIGPKPLVWESEPVNWRVGGGMPKAG